MSSHLFHHLIEYLYDLGLLGIFISLFIENIGIPFPIGFSYILAQKYIDDGNYSFSFMLTFLTASHLAGSLLAYAGGIYWRGVLGSYFARSVKFKRAETVITDWYTRYGSLTVLITRLIGYVRPWASYVAGFAGVRLGPFLLWTFIGTLVLNVVVLYFTKWLLVLWRQTEHQHSVLLLGIVFLGITILWGGFFARRFWHRKGNR